MNKELIYDYFGETEDDFYSEEFANSVLVQGSHYLEDPMITILIPTYDRPDYLRQAIGSALGQVGFDNYQIIVVDNEREPINQETDTSRLLEEYRDNTKIIYYRNTVKPYSKMNTCIALARSAWVVFLHDDDVLSPFHLYYVTQCIKKNTDKNILFLSEYSEIFMEGITDKEIEARCQFGTGNYLIRKLPAKHICTGYHPTWTGALINRAALIKNGGMAPKIKTGIGDHIKVESFHYNFGIYELWTDYPLYLRRIGKRQLTYSDNWNQLYVNKYRFHMYVNRKCHPIMHNYWDRVILYFILSEMQNTNEGILKHYISPDEFLSEIGKKEAVLFGLMYRIDQMHMKFYMKNVLLFRVDRTDRGVMKNPGGEAR